MKRVVLITGGGTGIGRGIALALAKRGFDVGLVGRRPEPLRMVAEEAQEYGVRAAVLPADLADSQERAMVVEQARHELGPLDLLVNNAGTLAGGALARLAPEAIERAVATNLTAPLLMTRLALPDLVARRGAVVLVGNLQQRCRSDDGSRRRHVAPSQRSSYHAGDEYVSYGRPGDLQAGHAPDPAIS